MTQIILNICFGLNIIIKKKKQEINKIEKKIENRREKWSFTAITYY